MLKIRTQINLKNNSKYYKDDFINALNNLISKVILCNNSHGSNIDLKKKCFIIHDYKIDKSGQLYLIGELDGPVKEIFITLIKQSKITINVMSNLKNKDCNKCNLKLFYFYADAI